MPSYDREPSQSNSPIRGQRLYRPEDEQIGNLSTQSYLAQRRNDSVSNLLKSK